MKKRWRPVGRLVVLGLLAMGACSPAPDGPAALSAGPPAAAPTAAPPLTSASTPLFAVPAGPDGVQYGPHNSSPTAGAACGKEYACIERHAVLSPSSHAPSPVPSLAATPVPSPETLEGQPHLAESMSLAQPSPPVTADTPHTGTEFVISCHEVWPGLNCGSDFEPMAGARLAFVDPRPGLDGRPHAIDLESRELAVLGEEAASLVGWSPSGEHLLTRQAEGRFTVYSLDGTTIKELKGLPAEPFWAPPDAFFGAVDWLAVPAADGALHAVPFPGGEARTVLPAGSLGPDGRGRVHWTAGGRLAWTPSLDQLAAAGGGEQVLHVGRADGNVETITWRLSDDVQEAYYQLVDWAPGTSLLLAGRGMLANSAWSWGVPLVVIDVGTGEVRELGASMLLTPESRAWHPNRPGLLALAEGGSRYLSDANRLALLDVTTGELQSLTGERLSAFEPAWSPDGRLLAYAAVPVPPDAEGSGEVLEGLLAGRAIYVLDPESGDGRAVTDPGEAIDGWPRWSPAPHRGEAGDARLLYTRQHDGYTDVRVARLDGTSDELFLTGLPDPTCFYGGCGWDRMLAYHADGVDDAMRDLLDDYSRALSSGQVAHEELYTHAMRALVQERRGFYRQFHEAAREVLVYEGKVQAVLYNNAVDIPPDVQAIADEIVGSFLLTFDLPDS